MLNTEQELFKKNYGYFGTLAETMSIVSIAKNCIYSRLARVPRVLSIDLIIIIINNIYIEREIASFTTMARNSGQGA